LQRRQNDEQRRTLDEQRRAQDRQQTEQRRDWQRDNNRRNGEQDRLARDNNNRNRQWSDLQRNEWRRREEQAWRQRQIEFRNRENDRQRAWQQRAQYLQQMRRLNQWRFQQQYWERLRQDQLRLQSFNYVDYGVPNYRYSRNGSYYDVNQYGANMLERAVNDGYAEGFRAGDADRQDGWQFDPEGCDAYQDATYGYDGYYVDMNEYQYYFREGFRRGYEDGYYGRNQYGSYSNGKYAILGQVLSVILNLIQQ